MRSILSLALAAAVFLPIGCATSGRNTDAGTLLGAAIGAGTGAIIGHQTGHRGAGAAIGAGIGALTGGLIGNSIDRSEQETDRRIARAEARAERALYEVEANDRLSLLDVIRMSQAGIRDDIIVAKIDQSGASFDLSTQDIIDLKRSSVSERVIEHMLRTRPARYSEPRGRTVYRTRTYHRYEYQPRVATSYDIWCD